MNAPLRYFGGKARLAPWIISHFPAHHVYCEPFGGGASVLFQKAKSRVEVYNDLNADVVNFFHMLRRQPEALQEAIELTPYARLEWEQCMQEPTHADPVEWARRFYVLSHQSRSAAGTNSRNSGWRYCGPGSKRGTAADSWQRTDDLRKFARRIREVQIECRPALDVLARYDSDRTLFYVDPPYTHAERSSDRHRYAHELTDAEHEALCRQLRDAQGMVVLSGYDNDAYAQLLTGWERHQKQVVDGASNTRIETLWCNFSTHRLYA